MEYDEKCKECPCYKAFHPKITVSVATFKCMKCGKPTPSFDTFKVEIDRKFLFWKYKKLLGHMCKKCATEEMKKDSIKTPGG